ncbi:hypothetical protein B0T19DRAFT_298581 [Cercophora scortea]|uniref:Uncharacterized protein n=1 Tax=Cercophora scortea TaxID=314031 RepID=A0AAE0I597_9PEZI|nr:hypothetical protein B0T19DRAFT_298581 [Cercophora scortea]
MSSSHSSPYQKIQQYRQSRGGAKPLLSPPSSGEQELSTSPKASRKPRPWGRSSRDLSRDQVPPPEGGPQFTLTGPSTSSNSANPDAEKHHSVSASSTSSNHAEPDEPPPWDRSVDVYWTDQTVPLDEEAQRDFHAFQYNSVRLAGESSILSREEAMKWYDDSCEEDTPKSPKSIGKRAVRPPKQRKDVSRKDNCSYTLLPNRVRFMITKLVVESYNSGKAIRLNSPSFFDPIWPVNHAAEGEHYWSTDYFDSLQKVLTLLKGYTSVCFTMRVDFMTTLLLTRRFHLILSPFVTENSQPAAVLWMDKFGPLMKWITLEIDMTKLGGHWNPSSAGLDKSKSLERVGKLVEKFVERQLTRHGGTTLQSLVVLVRRYYGNRPVLETDSLSTKSDENEQPGKDSGGKPSPLTPAQESESGPSRRPSKLSPNPDTLTGPSSMTPQPAKGVPYCADSHLVVLDPIKKLRGTIDTLCIIGASKAYVSQVVLALRGEGQPAKAEDLSLYCHYRAPSCTYPFTPGQSSALDYGPKNGGVRIAKHTADPREWAGLYGCRLSQNVTVTKIDRSGGAAPYFKLSLKGTSSTKLIGAVAERKSASLNRPSSPLRSPTSPNTLAPPKPSIIPRASTKMKKPTPPSQIEWNIKKEKMEKEEYESSPGPQTSKDGADGKPGITTTSAVAVSPSSSSFSGSTSSGPSPSKIPVRVVLKKRSVSGGSRVGPKGVHMGPPLPPLPPPSQLKQPAAIEPSQPANTEKSGIKKFGTIVKKASKEVVSKGLSFSRRKSS